ncbi:MAG: hypothetical protein U0559_01220 [Anaerolineae bacterium]
MGKQKPFTVTWRTQPVTIGKANQINNFCISAQGNQKRLHGVPLGMAGRRAPAATSTTLKMWIA